MYDIVACGEALIDFTESGHSASGMRLFEQNPGGAPCNVLCAASKCGSRTLFIGKVGDDLHGWFLRDMMEQYGIQTNGLVVDPHCFTTMAFVYIDDTGERSFSFARKPGADTQLLADEVDHNILRSCRIYHLGSLSLTDEPARSATMELLDTAKRAGAVVTYDPNYRKTLWRSEAEAKSYMLAPLGKVDFLKLSEEECLLMTGEDSLPKAAELFHAYGVCCVAVTLGDKGALISLKNKGCAMAPGIPIERAVDKTGAGDAFWGGFLNRYLAAGKILAELTLEDVKGYAMFGNALASLCIEKRGGMPSMPEYDEVMKRMGAFKGLP